MADENKGTTTPAPGAQTPPASTPPKPAAPAAKPVVEKQFVTVGGTLTTCGMTFTTEPSDPISDPDVLKRLKKWCKQGKLKVYEEDTDDEE